MLHAAQKREATGPRLGHPHSSAVRGELGQGFRELRPRAGRSRWRPIYRRVNPPTFVIFAVGPEAEIDSRGTTPPPSEPSLDSRSSKSIEVLSEWPITVVLS
jgi:hypothetical protein